MIRAAAPLLAALALAASGCAQRGFERILWIDDGIEADAAFFAAVEDLGFSAVTVSGAQDPAVPGAHGMRFYRDQIAGKGILELRQEPFEELQRRYERSRDPRVLQRPACLAEPATRQRLGEEIRSRLVPALPHHPLAVSLGDEISVTRHANPLDFCFSDACLAAFRRFVAERHGTVEALNHAWGTSFLSLDDVVPLTADRIRARELGGLEIPRNLRPWSEHLAFKDAQLAGVVEQATRQVHELAPGMPCGLTGMQPPSAYGGHDYRLLLPSATFYEAYDIGGARDLAACFAPPGAQQIATLFAPARDEPIELVHAQCFDMLAHGLSGMVVWSAAHVLDDENAPTAYGRAVADAARWLGPGRRAAGARIERSRVWIVESQPSVRAHWMLDSAQDGTTWIRRLSSYEAVHSTSLAARLSWLRLLQDLGLQPRFVAACDLPSMLRAEPPLLLVLPALLALADAEAAAVTAFVEGGGVAVADHGLALYDELLQRRETGALDALFGVRVRSLRNDDLLVRQGEAAERGRLAGGAAAAEAGLEGELAEPAGAFQVHLERRAGRGVAIYLNLAVCEYARARLEPSRVATAFELRRRVRAVAAAAGVQAPVEVRGDGLPTCIERILLRARDGARLLAVRINALDDRGLMRALGARGARRVELLFQKPVKLRDLLAGGEWLGPNVVFTAELDPWRGLLYEVVDAP